MARSAKELTMSSTTKTEQIQAASRKVFYRKNDDPPYPTYANAIEFTTMGMDIFMDVGAAHPESIQEAIRATQNPQDGPPHVDVSVQFRFGMTLQTAIQMHQRLTQMLQATQEQIKAAMIAAPKQEG